MAAVGGAQEQRGISEGRSTEHIDRNDVDQTGGTSRTQGSPPPGYSANQVAQGECEGRPPRREETATSSARSTTHSATSGYATDWKKELESNPEYKEILELLNLAEQANSSGGFYDIDRTFGGWLGAGLGDQIINWGNIEQAAKEGKGSTKRIAQLMLDNPKLFARADKDGNGELTSAELTALLSELRSKKSSMEGKAKAAALDSSSSAGPAPMQQGDIDLSALQNPVQSAPAEPQKNPADEKVKAELNKETPRPALSELDGLEGAAENMNNMVGWAESEIDRLTQLYSQTTDPGLQKIIENKMNALTRRMQQITAMLNQIMTMLSNLSKMQSDIAMNSIRNMR